MKLSLGFSPCPNDTFIFDALVNGKIDTEGLEFEPVLEDVQTLNQGAMEEKLDISKISYGVLPLVLNHYVLLRSGGALGKGAGPLLIAKSTIPESAISQSIVAIPGRNTTAHMLFSLAFPNATRKEFMIFSDIENAVLEERVDCGVIIHENRFTYQQKGLIKLVDLGKFWEDTTGCPIPLGGIVMKRGLGQDIQRQVNRLIRASLEHSFAHYPTITDYVRNHSQEMEDGVMRQHINLYVNPYSLDLGEDGKRAVLKLLEVLSGNGNPVPLAQEIFMA